MRKLILVLVALTMPLPSWGILYRSDYSGEFGTVNPNTAAFSVLGTPGSGSPVSGLCLDNTGHMWGSLRFSNNITDLIEINRSTGALINDVGPIKNGQANLKITDLACQPGTGVIFALDSSSPSKLFTINKTTAAATLVGATEVDRGGLAFASNGRLYAISVNDEFAEIDPADGSTIGSIFNTDNGCYDGFAIAPGATTEGFVTGCDSDDLYRVDLTNGNTTFVGDMGDYGADLEFGAGTTSAPAVSPIGLSALGLALLAMATWRLQRTPSDSRA